MPLRSFIICVMLYCCCSTFVQGSDIIKGRGKLRIDFDAARFFSDEKQVYVEFYYGVHENTLTYRPDVNGYSGEAHLLFTVKSESAVVAQKEFRIPHTITDTLSLLKNQIMTGLQTLGLPPGKYVASLVAYDANDIENRDSVALAVPVQLFPKDKEALSDIELSTLIQSSTNKGSLFYKNTLEVMPNPSKLFGAGLPIMYYYVEAYNLALSHSSDSVTVHTSVIDAAGREVVVQNKSKPRAHNASVEIGTVNLSALKGGTFLLRVNLLDFMNTLLASTAKKFFIYRPGGPIDTAKNILSSDFAKSEYSIMTEEDVVREYAYTRYLRSDFERKQYEALTDVPSRQKFLFEFWQKRKDDDAFSSNKFKADYVKRIDYADHTFTSGLRKGWLSDRGRVYVTYGAPEETERFPSASESNPYEIWHYNNVQGGVLFVFVDRNDSGEYILVHSTHRDELQDENWFAQYALRVK